MATNDLFGTRIATPQLRQTALQPAGIPGSTYVRPQQYEAGSNLNALANALGGLNSSLQAFAARREQKANDPNDEANRLFSAKVAQTSPRQIDDLMVSALKRKKLEVKDEIARFNVMERH